MLLWMILRKKKKKKSFCENNMSGFCNYYQMNRFHKTAFAINNWQHFAKIKIELLKYNVLVNSNTVHVMVILSPPLSSYEQHYSKSSLHFYVTVSFVQYFMRLTSCALVFPPWGQLCLWMKGHSSQTAQSLTCWYSLWPLSPGLIPLQTVSLDSS